MKQAAECLKKVIKSLVRRKDKLFLFLVLFLIPVLSLACSDGDVEIVSQEKFVDIYIEILKAQDSLGTSAVFMKPALEVILQRNGVSRRLYDKTVEFYMKNPEDYKDFMLLVEERLTALQESVGVKP